MPEQHALLSASSAEKWLNCTMAARMEEKMPNEAGESAKEGSLAHELAELKAKKHFTGMDKGTYTRKYNKIVKDELYQKDIDDYTDEYLEHLKDIEMSFATKPYAAFEVRVDYSNIAPEGFGTADCIMIGNGNLHIIDFKYGKTVQVDCTENPQMKLYAIGVLNKYGCLYSFDNIFLHIFQPRIKNVSMWKTTCLELLAWAEGIKPIAQMAYDGVGECTAGEWCDSHFCKCRAKCRAYISQMNAVVPYLDKLPQELSDEEVGQALVLAENIKKWYSIIEKYALTALLEGKNVPGWKIVEGRSNRAFNDVSAAYKSLVSSGIEEAVLYQKVPITLTDCEKLLGKKSFTELLSNYVVKPQGKPTVVKESDPRTPFSPAAADFEGLETKN